ncbi:MAG: 50S ribosomal protein L6 [Candidatus Odinarchaeia archaeon]
MGKFEYLEKIVEIPENIQVEVNGKKVKVTGERGTLEKDFHHAPVNISKENNKVKVYITHARKKEAATVGTIARHIQNMILGVSEGFTYKMKIVYSHFPINVKVLENENKVIIENFIGERAPRFAKIYGNVKVSIKGDDIIIEGNDIEEVSHTAANIQAATKIKDKDPRVFLDGIYVYQKLVGDRVFWKII